MMKLLMASSILSVVIALSHEKGIKHGDWIPGTSLMATVLIITFISSISAY